MKVCYNALMEDKRPGINVDILVIKDNKMLLGLLADKWCEPGKKVYGVPGRDIRFGEKIGETVKRNIKEEFDCEVISFKIICVNANYALGNHFIGIGVVAEMNGEAKNLLPEDWDTWEWFDKNEIPDNLFPATKNLIDCYLQHKVNISE
jgi:ADP-ribose pyrophosphatase YjhB (NUDIX family)